MYVRLHIKRIIKTNLIKLIMKNKCLYFICLVLFLSTPIMQAQFRTKGNGNLVKKERNFNTITGIEAGGALNIYLIQGDVQKVEVETDENLQEKIETTVDNGILKINTDSWIKSTKDINIYVTLKDLKSITASGATDVTCEKQFIVGNLNVDISGATNLKLNIKGIQLHLNSSGGTDATIKGAVGLLIIDSSGGSDVRAFDLTVAKAKVTSSGGSDVFVTVQDELEVSASGGSDVKFKGNPKITKSESSGGASIEKD